MYVFRFDSSSSVVLGNSGHDRDTMRDSVEGSHLRIDDPRLRIHRFSLPSERHRRRIPGDRPAFAERVLKQSSPQISVASRLLSSVPKSHPHTLKTSRTACVRGGAHRASAGRPLTFTPILSPYDWCL